MGLVHSLPCRKDVLPADGMWNEESLEATWLSGMLMSDNQIFNCKSDGTATWQIYRTYCCKNCFQEWLGFCI